jgi:hypothetical protein
MQVPVPFLRFFLYYSLTFRSGVLSCPGRLLLLRNRFLQQAPRNAFLSAHRAHTRMRAQLFQLFSVQRAAHHVKITGPARHRVVTGQDAVGPARPRQRVPYVGRAHGCRVETMKADDKLVLHNGHGKLSPVSGTVVGVAGEGTETRGVSMLRAE